MIDSTFRQKIKNVDWIFFDYFDTVVHRNINDGEILEHWAFLLAPRINYILSEFELYQYRKVAVRDLYQNSVEVEEYDYKSIMKRMYVMCHTLLNQISFEMFYQLSLETEIEV